VFGNVVGIYINDDIIRDGVIDMNRFHPLARMGYHDYAVITEVFTITKPQGVDPLIVNPAFAVTGNTSTR
jgi:hypothetical protein